MALKARWFTKEFRDARFGGNVIYALPESQARPPGSCRLVAPSLAHVHSHPHAPAL